MAFATYEDVEARWRTLTAGEQAKVTTMLDDASNMLLALVRVDESDGQQQALLRQVCCSMAIRSLVASESTAFGVDQLQATMGPFTQQMHFANPNGDLYLTKQEKKLLGIGRNAGRILYPSVGCDAPC